MVLEKSIRLFLPAAGLMALASCSALQISAPASNDGGDLLMLTLTESPAAHMEALFKGSVVADARGCLRLRDADGATVIWPKDFRLVDRLGAAMVQDEGGRTVGAVGGDFRFGGGEVPMHDGLALSAEARRAAEERCPGKYWIVGELSRQ